MRRLRGTRRHGGNSMPDLRGLSRNRPQTVVLEVGASSNSAAAGLKVVMNKGPKIELVRSFWGPKLDLGI